MSLTRTHPTSRGPVTLRPTRPEDEVAYRELRLKALREHPEMYGSDYTEFTARPSEYWQELVQRGASGPHGITYVAETDGALIGMSTLIRETGIKVEHNGMIIRVYVHPDWRGLHLSEVLVDACLAYASILGLRTVKLGVVVTNAAAIRCYLRCGFAVYGVEPEVIHYNDAYYDELLMARRLTGDR